MIISVIFVLVCLWGCGCVFGGAEVSIKHLLSLFILVFENNLSLNLELPDFARLAGR